MFIPHKDPQAGPDLSLPKHSIGWGPSSFGGYHCQKIFSPHLAVFTDPFQSSAIVRICFKQEFKLTYAKKYDNFYENIAQYFPMPPAAEGCAPYLPLILFR